MSEWQPIATAPFGEMVLLFNSGWRVPFAGMVNGDHGSCWIDTCDAGASGWQTCAHFWMPLPEPPRDRQAPRYAECPPPPPPLLPAPPRGSPPRPPPQLPDCP